MTTPPVRIAIGASPPALVGLRTGRVVVPTIRSTPSGGCDAANVATVTRITQEVHMLLDPFLKADPDSDRPMVRVTDCTGQSRKRFFRSLDRARRYVERVVILPSVVEVYTAATWFDGDFHDERCTITIKGRTRTQRFTRRDDAADTAYPIYIESHPTHVDTTLPVAIAA